MMLYRAYFIWITEHVRPNYRCVEHNDPKSEHLIHQNLSVIDRCGRRDQGLLISATLYLDVLQCIAIM